jgi:hypothetical protein
MAMLPGSDRGVLAENIKSYMRKGHSQAKAIKLASRRAKKFKKPAVKPTEEKD